MRIDERPGTGAPSLALHCNWAEIALVDDDSIESALVREVSVPRPDPVQTLIERRADCLEPEGRRTFWLTPLLLTPFAHEPVDLRDRIVRIALRNLPAGKTIGDLARFSPDDLAHSARFMTAAKWFNLGTWHAYGFPEYMYADTLDLIDARDPEEAIANDAELLPTPEMTRIDASRGQFLDLARERFVLWFSPAMAGSVTQRPLRLTGGRDDR